MEEKYDLMDGVMVTSSSPPDDFMKLAHIGNTLVFFVKPIKIIC